MSELLRVSVTPSGWSACVRSSRAGSTPRRRPVIAWGVLGQDGARTVVGLVARAQDLVRGDRLAGFEGYAAGPGTEPQLEPPALPPADLNEAMYDALELDAADSWDGYEVRIREQLTSVAEREWATSALAGFEQSPRDWFRYWMQSRREHEATERDLMRRLRALSHLAPGRSLDEALAATGITLGDLLAMDLADNQHSQTRAKGELQGENAS